MRSTQKGRLGSISFTVRMGVIFMGVLHNSLSMLKNAKIMAFTGTRDAARAKSFNRAQLGLTLVEENSFALVFAAAGTMLRVTNVPDLTPAQYTVLGWAVPDIAATVRVLAAKGVAFARYPGLTQDNDCVWTSPAGARVAWFADPDGNILSLTQNTKLQRIAAIEIPR